MNRRKRKKRGPGRYIAAAVVMLACILVLGFALSAAIDANVPVQTSPADSLAASVSQSVPAPQPEEIKVHFSAVGDNLVHNGIYLQAQARAGGTGYDFSYCFENLTYFFEQFDVNWMNQETLVNNELPPDTYPNFSTPGEMGQATYDAGWRVYALSNNHTYDKLAPGIAATRRFWASMPEDVVTVGLFTNNEDDSGIALQEVNGLTIAYLSYTESTNGIPTPADAEAHIIYTSEVEIMERQVRRARELADMVVVGVHWGVENSHIVTDGQRALAANYAAWGADVIIGTHPHVVQGVEWITNPEDGREVLVAYSLGNFLSAQSQADNLIGMVFTFDINQRVEADGTRNSVVIDNVKVYPTVTHYDAGYANIRDYMFRDYTAELASQHGVRGSYPSFSLEYIQSVMEEYIDPEFLILD